MLAGCVASEAYASGPGSEEDEKAYFQYTVLYLRLYCLFVISEERKVGKHCTATRYSYICLCQHSSRLI
jgi:hypothetical protein